ncbi:hypothetical protein V6N13_057151 [Hibiscus sabdariffa]
MGNEGSIDSSIRNIAGFITVVDQTYRFGSKPVLLIPLGDAARLLSFKGSLSCTTCQIESLILVVYKSLTPLASQNFSYSLIF